MLRMHVTHEKLISIETNHDNKCATNSKMTIMQVFGVAAACV